jgi:hypothetical protein
MPKLGLAPCGFLLLGFSGFEQKKKTPNHLRSSKIRFYLVLFGFFALKKKSNESARKFGVFPPLMITASWNTHDGNWNKTMILFVEIRLFQLKPKTQCIGQKKLGFLHLWLKLTRGSP